MPPRKQAATKQVPPQKSIQAVTNLSKLGLDKEEEST